MNSASYHLWLDEPDPAREAAREWIGFCEEIQITWTFRSAYSTWHRLPRRAAILKPLRAWPALPTRVSCRIDEPRQRTEQMLYDRLMKKTARASFGHGTRRAHETRATMTRPSRSRKRWRCKCSERFGLRGRDRSAFTGCSGDSRGDCALHQPVRELRSHFRISAPVEIFDFGVIA